MRYLHQELIGKKFGRLLLNSFEKIGERIYYHCQCDCGNKTRVRKDALKLTQSCGCAQVEAAIEVGKNKKLPKGVAARNQIYHKYKQRAKSKGIEFRLSYEEFLEYIVENCVYCGCKPKQKSCNCGKKNDFCIYNGIDRVDNKQGYISSNCVPCCGDCNRAKGDLTLEEFKKLIAKVHQRFVCYLPSSL